MIRMGINIYVLLSILVLVVFSSLYVTENDLAVYANAIYEKGLYEGDYAFELLQTGLAYLFGTIYVIQGMQFVLLLIVYIYIILIDKTVTNNIYIISTIIMWSPLVVVGLTNSIRQSIAFIMVLLAFEFRIYALRIIFFVISILTHKASFVLIALLSIMHFASKQKKHTFRFRLNLTNILYIGLSIVISSVFAGFLSDYLLSVFDRYSVYLYSAEVFTEGRIGPEKIAIWVGFWLAILIISKLYSFGRPSLIFAIIPLIYTTFLGADSYIRGFDEFQARLLMINNVFVISWLVQTGKNGKNNALSYSTILAYTILNPSTIGVIL